ncbi:ferrous iron transport protein A [Nakamurella antarctica]|uniref:Ferrous iron transport protein A n=1 Tax=Nakamurella antarctica TaxID=1902245 RepID=A0A3G8ZPV1_9ACTN|nr:ferrous iron transport protein A [Nakamurella antarctica]
MDDPDSTDKTRSKTLADRAALEQILGHSLADRLWPSEAMALGTPVRVIQDPEWGGPWAREFFGVIDDTAPPELIASPKAQPGEFTYFVRFNEPELDRDGDGPYRKAMIWGRYLLQVGTRRDH